MGRWRGEGNWGKLEGKMNHERLWTLENSLRVLKGRGGGKLGEPGGGYYGGHLLREALGAMSSGTLKRNFKKEREKLSSQSLDY